MTLPESITRLHAAYVRLTGCQERQVWCEAHWKTLLQDYGFDDTRLEADLTHAARYLRRRISEGKRNEEALVARNFLALERFTELVGLAKAAAPSLSTTPPVKPAGASFPTWDSVSEAEADRLREHGKRQMTALLASLQRQ